ncbi:MAG TPA: phytanoyl-CoA dioxygenase family protein [Caulobacteraceae bacterium]|jgi:ectoine hydroxylase-related dioxygenase (phytanoyl-CoA dioxygenase family)
MDAYPHPPRQLPAGFDAAGHIQRLHRDGYTILDGYLDAGQLAVFRDGIEPFLGQHHGRNPFEGLKTERVYTLVARGKLFEDIAADPRLLTLLDAFLRPGYLLSASHAICIHPGEAAQDLHTDDSFYPIPRPRPAISMSVIGAIDAFTPENGGTVILPGSHKWATAEGLAVRDALQAGQRIPQMEGMFKLAMSPGSIALFQGTLIHGAGANTSASPRLAFTNQYCEPWARTQENFYLGVPKDRVRRMSPEVQSLLGYNIMPPFMGQVTASHPLKTLNEDWVAPVARGLATGED